MGGGNRVKKALPGLVICSMIATACGEDSAGRGRVLGPTANVQSQSACASTDSIRHLIRNAFAVNNDRTAANARFTQIVRRLGLTAPGPDTAGARTHAMVLIGWTLRKYEAGRLNGGTSLATRALVEELVNQILCTVGLPANFGAGALDPDGAVVIVTPTTDTTIVTETEWAGVDIDPGSVTTTTLVTIQRLPDDASPLLTSFDQYPLYYEFTGSPTPSFTTPVVVGVCQAASIVPPDPSRLRLAHNVAPYGVNDIEVLSLVAVPFLDCTDADVAAGPSRGMIDLATAGGRMLFGAMSELLGPRRLMASPAYALTGIGGSVRTFSPFGAIDTLGYMDASNETSQVGKAWHPAMHAPAVDLRTPTGAPMGQIPIAFAVTLGGGTVGSPLVMTGPNGVAATTWTFGGPGQQRVTATAMGPAGTGFIGSPRLFTATAY